MSGLFGVLKIELGNFNTLNSEELVTFLRQAISKTRQIGWEQFNEQLAVTPERRNRSRRARIVLTLIFGAHTIAFGIVWVVGRELQYLVMSGVNAVVAAYLIRVHWRDHTASARHAGEHADARETSAQSVLNSTSTPRFP